MDDLISRRDAINAVSEITTTMSVCTNKDECYGMKRMQKQVLTELANLQSAEPEPSQVARDIATILENEKDMRVIATQSEIVRCKDCKYQTESWSGIKYCEAHGDHIGKDYDYCSNARRKENGQTDFTASCD